MPVKTVLLVEEDDDLREELARELRYDGYRVVTLEDGLELCDYLELALHSNGKVPTPELIISDVELAGFGGIHICRMLSQAEDAVPIILLSPDGTDAWEDASHSGALCVLDRGGNLGELHDAIASYLQAP